MFNVPGTICLHKFDAPNALPKLHKFAPRKEPTVSNDRLAVLHSIFAEPKDPDTCDKCIDLCTLCICSNYMWYKRRYNLNEYAVHPQRIVRGFIAR